MSGIEVTDKGLTVFATMKDSFEEVSCDSPFELGARNIDWLHEMYDAVWHQLEETKDVEPQTENHELSSRKCSLQFLLLHVECLEQGGMRNRIRWNVQAFLGKWNSFANDSIFGAAERFYAALSENNRKLLVERAVSIYDGQRFRNKSINIENQILCRQTSLI